MVSWLYIDADPMTLAERIRRARGKRPQAEIARAVGVSREAVSQWETGDTKSLSMDNVFRLADALGRNPKWLATGRGPEFPGHDLHAGEETGFYGAALTPAAVEFGRRFDALPPLLQKQVTLFLETQEILATYLAGSLRRNPDAREEEFYKRISDAIHRLRLSESRTAKTR